MTVCLGVGVHRHPWRRLGLRCSLEDRIEQAFKPETSTRLPQRASGLNVGSRVSSSKP